MKRFDGKSPRQRPDHDRRPRPDKPRDPVPSTDDRGRPDSQRLYGLSPVLEALRADSRRVEKVAIALGASNARIAEILELCRTRSIPFTRIDREALERDVPAGANHQGVSATIAAAGYVSVEAILDAASDTPLLLVLDGVEDPRNLGAIIRVAECAGVDGVIIPERRAVGLTDTVAKSSAGAVEHVRVAKAPNLNRLIEELKRRSIWVVGASADSETPYTDWDWTTPTALVLGGEGRGLHRLVAENCDELVKIPIYGKIESLNVSVAAGVLIFEARRQRGIGA